jgi:hypothetical protein
LKPEEIPKVGTKVSLTFSDYPGSQCTHDIEGTIMSQPFMNGYVAKDGNWTGDHTEGDEPCWNVAFRSHKEREHMTVRVNSLVACSVGWSRRNSLRSGGQSGWQCPKPKGC